MEYKFTVTETEANYILNCIQELPAKIANPLTQKLQLQAKEQQTTQALPESE
jgi:hypothetical protein